MVAAQSAAAVLPRHGCRVSAGHARPCRCCLEQLRCRRERLGSVALRGRWECGHRGASPRRLARRISFSMLGLYVSWKTGAGSAGALSALHGGSDPSRRCPSLTLLGNCVDHEADQPGGHDAQKQKGEATGKDRAIAKYGQSGFCVYCINKFACGIHSTTKVVVV